MQARIMSFRRALMILGAVVTAGITLSCGGGGLNTSAGGSNGPDAGRPGVVYTMSNGSGGNAVLAFNRNADGTLQAAGIFPTGGTGTSSGLENQGALAVSEDGRFLLVVNPASDDFTIFRITSTGLEVTSRMASGGKRPVSITSRGTLIYVLNAGSRVGESDNVTGFRLVADGTVAALSGSTRPLSSAAADPVQVQLSPNADLLVVTERGTNVLTSYTLDANGIPAVAHANPSAGIAPFGFTFSGSTRLFVSEAGTNSASSYAVQPDGSVRTISAAIPTSQRAVCWLAVTPDGRFAYTANTGSGSITGFRIASDGSLQILNPDGLTADTSGGPLDMAPSPDGQWLYALTNGQSIEVFRIDSTSGSLTKAQTVTGLPAGSNGLVAD